MAPCPRNRSSSRSSVPRHRFASYLRTQAGPRGVLVVAVSAASGVLPGLAMPPPGHESRHRISGSAHERFGSNVFRGGSGVALVPNSRERSHCCASTAESEESLAVLSAACYLQSAGLVGALSVIRWPSGHRERLRTPDTPCESWLAPVSRETAIPTPFGVGCPKQSN